MPVIRVSWWKGRTKEQKDKVAEGIEGVIQKECGTKPGDTHIIFEDVDKSNWAMGGKLQA
ncbi:4-oxalocrotonate tautomerase family protein [Candidatus Margulisiibacteriota bacterium]